MHELIHVVIRDSHGDLPPWLEEGLAALYEVSRIDANKRVDGTVNWRGCVFRNFWLEPVDGNPIEPPPIEKLVRMDWREFDNLEVEHLEYEQHDRAVARQAINHATARYFLLYAQEQGKLRDLFLQIAQRDPLDVTGDPGKDAAKRVESVLGDDLDSINHNFLLWLEPKIQPIGQCH